MEASGVVSTRSAQLLTLLAAAARAALPAVILPSFATMWRGAFWLLGLAAIVPASTGDVRSHPHPAKSYSDAVGRAHLLIAADDSVVAEGGATILRDHGHRSPRAVVLIHGFTDSPKQFADLADSLYARGDNVFVPVFHITRSAEGM